MSDLAEEFGRVPLFLEWIRIIGCANDLNVVGDEFPFLSFALRWNQRATHND